MKSQPERPFLVCGLPRSRTAWMAAFLDAAHEPASRWAGYDDALTFYRSGGVSCDSLQTLIARKLLRDVEGMVVAVIHRSIVSVRRSLSEMFPQSTAVDGMLSALSGEMDKIRMIPGTLHVEYNDLDVVAAPWLYEKLRGVAPDPDMYDDMRGVNVQVDPNGSSDLIEAHPGRFLRMFGEFISISREP